MALRDRATYEADMRQFMMEPLAEKRDRLAAEEKICLLISAYYGDVMSSKDIWSLVRKTSKTKVSLEGKGPKCSLVGWVGIKTLEVAELELSSIVRKSVSREESRVRKGKVLKEGLFNWGKDVATYSKITEKQLPALLEAHRACFDKALQTP